MRDASETWERLQGLTYPLLTTQRGLCGTPPPLTKVVR